MLDSFALLGLAPRPWLDPLALKDAFHRLAARQHPDASTGSAADFTSLNAAHARLRDPAARLRHLLELQFPEAPPSRKSIPLEVADLFSSIAVLQQHAAEFLARQTAAGSPLARALLATERGEVTHALTAMLTELERLFAILDDRTRALDSAWDARGEAAIGELADLAQSYAYLQRWRDQLSEARTRLTL